MTEDLVRRRNLPHIDVDGKPYFITACLDGSIPAAGLKKIRDYRSFLEKQPRAPNQAKSQRKRIHEKLVFKFVDDLLDHESPVTHLENERLADEVQKSLLHFANQRYQLLAFVIMPSHHHWLFLPDPAWVDQQAQVNHQADKRRSPREIISHSVQSFTGHQCNKLLGRSGQFWQRETWDHFVRDDAEMFRIINYIEQNPVKAKLVDSPIKYKWSSARVRFELGLPPGSPIPKVA